MLWGFFLIKTRQRIFPLKKILSRKVKLWTKKSNIKISAGKKSISLSYEYAKTTCRHKTMAKILK